MHAATLSTERAGAPLARCLAVAAATTLVDQASKLVAAARLDGVEVPLAGDVFLTLVYNDTFARGMALGGATLPATLLLASTVLLLAGRACAPLSRVDRGAPWGLGLVAGATVGNAVDFLHTGRGAVDFLAVGTADGALVFNLADVAAYAGVALLARSAWRIARLVRAERAATAASRRLQERAERERPVNTEVERPVPLFTEPGVPSRPAERPATPVEPEAEDQDVGRRA